jgi:hypothetical protein
VVLPAPWRAGAARRDTGKSQSTWTTRHEGELSPPAGAGRPTAPPCALNETAIGQWFGSAQAALARTRGLVDGAPQPLTIYMMLLMRRARHLPSTAPQSDSRLAHGRCGQPADGLAMHTYMYMRASAARHGQN